MPLVTYRLHGERPAPRRIRMDVPGWGGEKQTRADGSHEQPWHCLPFSESAIYGLELCYPFDTELRVTNRGGRVQLNARWGDRPSGEPMWPPFRPFGEDYYSYQLSLDLAVPGGWAVRTEPHPRYFTDPTNTTPLAVPALIRSDWWPMTFFCIFKAPPRGVTHIFRKGEPFVSFIVLPADPDIELQPMPEEEAAQRELRSRRLAASRDKLAVGTRWLSTTNTVFDGTYRNLARAARAKGKG
jgi:hypothetical protein